MCILINILICFFVFLIVYQIVLENNLIEGFTKQYKEYDKNNPNNALILAQQNAGNIEYLKERIGDVQGLYRQVQDISGNVVTLQDQVNGLVQAQKDYADQMTGGTPPEITGAVDGENSQDTNST